MTVANEISARDLRTRRRRRTARSATGDPPSSAAWSPREWWIERAPKTANAMLRSHWAAQRREVTKWVEAHAAVEWGRGPWHEGRPEVAGPAQVELRVLVLRGHRQDPDNAIASMKPLLDALRRRGWLFDDSPRWLRIEVEERSAGVERTLINWKLLPTTPQEVLMVKSTLSKKVRRALVGAGRKAAAPKKAKVVERVVQVNGVHLGQALAFVQVCLKAGAVKSHLEAALGLGNVAAVKDFESHDGDAQGRADAFIGYLELVAHQLDARLRDNPRQLEIVKEAVTPKENGAPAEKKAEEPAPAIAAEAV